MLFYHSYPQLLQWKVLFLFVPNNPYIAVSNILDVIEISLRLVDEHVGHLGLFNNSFATALLYAICSGDSGFSFSIFLNSS